MGDKGKLRSSPNTSGEGLSNNRYEATGIWAIVMTKELWKKGFWNDAKSIVIVALERFHPTVSPKSKVHLYTSSSAATKSLRIVTTRVKSTPSTSDRSSINGEEKDAQW
ncbi:hypothetical protein BGW80DRAFT_1344400 [Lactifluus volemus]|nr:hypothetical protein BGW80DRAFT_1344400 [Lactifluus volemus]